MKDSLNQVSQRDNKINIGRLRIAIATLWIVLLSILTIVIIRSDLQDAERSFQDNVARLYNQISDSIRINETVVEGFAASVEAIGGNNQQKIRTYAREMLRRFPHIFMFEIAEKVSSKNKAKFEARYRKDIFPDFKIRKFGYETDRNWHHEKDKAFYMPITFMEPFPEGSRKVLGLDLTSNRFFVDSLRKSAKLHIPVATDPFTLVEGKLAYLIHRAIGSKVDHSGLDERYVMLVILARSLFKENLDKFPACNITLYHSDFRKDDNKGYLANHVAVKSGVLESMLFPLLSFREPLDSRTQPFILSVDYQTGWNVLNWWLLAILYIAGVVSFLSAMKYAKIYHQSEIVKMETADHLFYLANHDSLTGLANRNLLLDRLQHALSQAERNGTKLAVLFLDLDEFKSVNDSYGHATGDRLLCAVTERLRACLRTGDTLARLSGDEFVLVLENVESVDNVYNAIEKIEKAFEGEFIINNAERKITISIGFAIYPDDAVTQHELLEMADRRMYEVKNDDRSHRTEK